MYVGIKYPIRTGCVFRAGGFVAECPVTVPFGGFGQEPFRRKVGNVLKIMVGPAGLEPATKGL